MKKHIYKAALEALQQEGMSEEEVHKAAHRTLLGKTTMFPPSLLMQKGAANASPPLAKTIINLQLEPCPGDIVQRCRHASLQPHTAMCR